MCFQSFISLTTLFYRFSTSQWYDENGKVLRRYPTNEEIDKSVLSLFTKVSILLLRLILLYKKYLPIGSLCNLSDLG